MAFVPAANAQVSCLSSRQAIPILEQEYDKGRVSIAITDGGAQVERWESYNGSWALILHMPMDCVYIITFGENWRELIAKPRGQKVDD